jgi:hypothetical protein|tara:strand:- start:1921 stop:2235 length:315 start_codon:yes stop_codon:yes gene_type:complete
MLLFTGIWGEIGNLMEPNEHLLMTTKETMRAADQRRTRVNLTFHKGTEQHVRVLRDAQHLADQLGFGIAELGRVGLAMAVENPTRTRELFLKTGASINGATNQA